MHKQINSPIEIVFDLCRCIDFHKISTGKTKEEAIAGVTSGLINQYETVTWRARHLFKTRTFTSKITSMQRPFYFKDEMQQSDFKKFVHEHFFEQNENGTLMKDKLVLEAPFGFAGKLATCIFLKNFIRKFLICRNQVIKQTAQGNDWKKILNYNE